MASHHDSDRHAELTETPDSRTVVDPVCAMTVDTTAAKLSYEHQGELFHFSSQGCPDKFVANPVHYLTGEHIPAAEEVPPGRIFTYPMHPEIKQEEPGSCPICGMALEPMGRRGAARVRTQN